MYYTMADVSECVWWIDVTAFGRPLVPPPTERRPPPNFVERPPFSFDQFGRPIFAPPATGPPPVWEPRYFVRLSVSFH